MDVSLTEEQLEWQQTVQRLATAHATTSADEASRGESGWDAVLVVGVPALRSPHHSGVDAAGVETALAVEATGRTLSTLPILGQAVIAPELLARAGATAALDAVLEGTLRFAPGLTTDLCDFARLGEQAVVLDADSASHALVIGDDGRLVAVEMPDLGRHRGLDLTRRLTSLGERGAVDIDLGGPIDPDGITRARAVALTGLAADLLGVMDGAVNDAVAYAADRHQFGVPIGSFQAVQHLLADAAVSVEGARSCVLYAAWSGDNDDVDDAILAARTAKAYCSSAGVKVVEATVQVFGGIAITWEHRSHVRLRRVHLDRQCFGDEHVHHRAIASARLAKHDVA